MAARDPSTLIVLVALLTRPFEPQRGRSPDWLAFLNQVHDKLIGLFYTNIQASAPTLKEI